MTTIRLVTEADANAVLAIYVHYVRETAISFEYEPPTVEEFAQRIATNLERAPWLVCERDGELLGYAYAGRFQARAAYQWSVEASVYVHRDHHRKGVATALYTTLIECLKAQGYRRAIAGIALPNEASVRFHERFGFTPVGVYRAVGWKLGRWHDVGYWERPLDEGDDPPAPAMPLTELLVSEAWDDALRKGRDLLRMSDELR